MRPKPGQGKRLMLERCGNVHKKVTLHGMLLLGLRQSGRLRTGRTQQVPPPRHDNLRRLGRLPGPHGGLHGSNRRRTKRWQSILGPPTVAAPAHGRLLLPALAVHGLTPTTEKVPSLTGRRPPGRAGVSIGGTRCFIGVGFPGHDMFSILSSLLSAVCRSSSSSTCSRLFPSRLLNLPS